MFLDPQGRLWLVWITIQSNRWESSLLKYQRSEDFLADGAPRWNDRGVIHLKPPAEFADAALAHYDRVEPSRLAAAADEDARKKVRVEFATYRALAKDRLSQRLGWMPRAHPFVLEGRRLILPLYSDGFDFSLMALSDDGGETWRTSAPLLGEGNIQPSVVRRRDGSLLALMRDNGPPPKRLHQAESRDGGETWSAVTDHAVPNPGSGAEIVGLRDGLWALISNDTETGRHRLTVRLSEDEGRTWRWIRALEDDAAGPDAGRYHYPSLVEAADGTLHATYSHHTRGPAKASGQPGETRKTIKHVHFNREWLRADAPAAP